MIQIINTIGLTLQLNADTAIAIDRFNPLFLDKDDLFEDITYPFSSPANYPNKEFYSSGHLVEAEKKVYEMEVQVIVNGSAFYAGKINYSFKGGEFDNVLLVSFGALADKAKTVKMRDIYTQDAVADLYTPAEMKTVCQNPKDYHYSFFPIWNESWSTLAKTYPMVNNWNHVEQKFSLVPLNNIGYTATVPYFKLKHIIIKLMEFFGLQAQGSWLDLPESETIYCYNLILTGRANKIYDSFIYLPTSLTPTDFLKIIKERFQISCSPDIFKGVAHIESAKSILKSDDTLDLSEFIYNVEEISVSDKEGFSVTLKPDSADELFIDTLNTAEVKHIATNKLVVGTGKTAIEMKSSTLKSRVFAAYSMPTAKQPLFDIDVRNADNPIRFLNYTGMKTLPDSKVFPEATPIELNETDATWWRFLNDSKKLKLKGAIPPYILESLRSVQRIGFTTKEGNYSIAMCEKISFSLTNDDAELVETEIEARTIVANFETPVAIEDLGQVLEDQTLINVKSYFNSDVSGVRELNFDVYYAEVRTIPVGPRTDSGVLKKSTDRFGIGGETLNMTKLFTAPTAVIELRVKTAAPKYAIIKSVKYLFTQRDDYWYIPLTGLFRGDFIDANGTSGSPLPPPGDRSRPTASGGGYRLYIGDNRGIWIVF